MSTTIPVIKCEVVENEKPEIKYIDELRKANSKINLMENAMQSLNEKLSETENHNTKLTKQLTNMSNMLDSKTREIGRLNRVHRDSNRRNPNANVNKTRNPRTAWSKFSYFLGQRFCLL